MMKQVMLVGLGGFVGSVARYFVSKLNLSIEWYAIPVGTLTANILGSLLIGFLTGVVEKSPILTADLRLLLMVGLCGGFTTFSSFTNENLMLMHNGQYLPVILYTSLSIILGFSAVFLGYASSNLL